MAEDYEDISWGPDGQPPSGRTNPPESTWLAFTEIHIGTRRWNLTLREGMTHTGVDEALDLLAYATRQAAGLGAAYQPQDETPSESTRVNDRAPQEQPSSRSARRDDADSGVWNVARLEIAGNRSKPMVQMFDANPRLQFPVTNIPSDVLIGMLESTYGKGTFDSSLDKLRTCGEVLRVEWEVVWVRSPKDPKWKDIYKIVIPKLEQRNG